MQAAEMMGHHAILGLWMLLAASASASLPKEMAANENEKADIGRWAVGDCIIAEFAMEFTISPGATDGNSTEMTVLVPKNATVDSRPKNCMNDTQQLVLSWQDRAWNDSSVSLDRNLTVVFQRRANESYYGVMRFFAVFELAHFPFEVANKTENATSMLQIDSSEYKKLMFHTPVDRSFLCANINPVSLATNLRYSFNPMPKKMNGTMLQAKHVHFDAFRPKKDGPPDFRTPMDCDYKPNDIIPIAVGVALAALVIAVLVAYMIGRRRVRQQGYQSV